MTPEHLAKEADRLQADEILQNAFDDVKAEALEALALADADDKTKILRLQQKVAVVEEIRAQLDRYILAAGGTEDETSPYA